MRRESSARERSGPPYEWIDTNIPDADTVDLHTQRASLHTLVNPCWST